MKELLSLKLTTMSAEYLFCFIAVHNKEDSFGGICSDRVYVDVISGQGKGHTVVNAPHRPPFSSSPQ